MRKHRFHFVLDKSLLKKVDDFILSNSLKSREKAINYILNFMDKYLRKEISKGFPNKISDNCTELMETDITVNINLKSYDKLRFLKYVGKTFSYATILRRIIRLYFDRIVIKNKKRIDYKYRVSTHMNSFLPYEITLSYNFRIKKLFVPPIE